MAEKDKKKKKPWTIDSIPVFQKEEKFASDRPLTINPVKALRRKRVSKEMENVRKKWDELDNQRTMLLRSHGKDSKEYKAVHAEFEAIKKRYEELQQHRFHLLGKGIVGKKYNPDED